MKQIPCVSLLLHNGTGDGLLQFTVYLYSFFFYSCQYRYIATGTITTNENEDETKTRKMNSKSNQIKAPLKYYISILNYALHFIKNNNFDWLLKYFYIQKSFSPKLFPLCYNNKDILKIYLHLDRVLSSIIHNQFTLILFLGELFF